ncbi:MAG: hypothetical protein PUA62_08615 [Lachnospiraceae bacterium]|nr:hypothetical protein [Lachnospiraceae bacterium]
MAEFSINMQAVMQQTTELVECSNSIKRVREMVDSANSFLFLCGLSEIGPALNAIEASLLLHQLRFKHLSTELSRIILLYGMYEGKIQGQSIFQNPYLKEILENYQHNKDRRAQADHDTVNTDEMTYEEYVQYRIENAVDDNTRRMYERYVNASYSEHDDKDSGWYNDFLNSINYNAADDDVNPRGRGTTYFHEFGHMVDDKSDWNDQTSNDWSYEFGDCLEQDFENYVDRVMEENGYTDRQDAYDYINDWLMDDKDMKNGVSDILCGLSDGKVCGAWCHESDYYTDSSIENEAFAHFFEAGMYDDPVKLEYIKEMFPTAYEEYQQMIIDDLES